VRTPRGAIVKASTDTRCGSAVGATLAAVGCAWHWTRSIRRRRAYAIAGAVLGLAAPLGLLLSRALEAGQAPTVAWVAGDLALVPVTYAYLTLTGAVLAVLGYLLGRSSDRLRLLSITDPLTGLLNRRHFGERMADEMRRGRRYARTTSVLCLDIDNLKDINDRFGHKAGDDVILAVSGTLRANLRAVDSVGRLGGDEFAVLLPETSARQAGALSLRIVRDVADCGAWGRRIGVSIGVAAAEPSSVADDPLARADAALYCAKAAGGGRAVLAISRREALALGPVMPPRGPGTQAARLAAPGEPDGVAPEVAGARSTTPLPRAAGDRAREDWYRPVGD
jgi:diguanylate cyclase (GGDEF)-like protein